MPKANIFIGTPCYGGMVTHHYMQSILKLMAYAATRDIVFSLGLLAHDSLIPRARNTLMARFLDTPEFTHLFFVDADIGFDPEAFDRLLCMDQDFTAGMYPLKVIHWPQVVQKMGKMPPEKCAQAGLNYVGIPCSGADREEKQGFVTGDYAGTGFMLLKRVVAERMAAGYEHLHYKMAQTYPPPKDPSMNQYNLFECIVDPETKTYLSEDFTFCKRWRALGGRIWLDQQSKLTHIGSCPFEGGPLDQA